MPARVLVVDDDAEMRDALGLFFSSQGHECELAPDAAAALGIVERVTVDAVVCDVRLQTVAPAAMNEGLSSGLFSR